MDKGWKKFADYYSLSRGNLLVFRYDGNSQFHVIILDTSTMEIDYPFNPNHFEKHDIDKQSHELVKEEIEDDVSIEVLDSFSPCPRTRDKSPSPCSQPHKKKRTSAFGKTLSNLSHHRSSSKVNFDLYDKEGGDKFIPGRSMKPEDFIRKQRLNAKQKAKALKRASGFKSKDPFFMVAMQPSFVGAHPAMILPSLFAKKYLCSENEDVILKVQDGRTWSVKYSFRLFNGSPKARFNCGWKAFAHDNSLKVGDVCVFVLTKSIGILFEVAILYENAVANNSSMLPAMQTAIMPLKRERNLSVKFESACTSNDKNSVILQNQITKTRQEKIIVELGDKSMKLKSEENIGGQVTKRPSSSKISRASEAASRFFSTNPYFQVALQSYQMEHRRQPIPITFARRYFKKKTQTMTLQVGERSWTVKLLTYKYFSKFSAGWAAFARENSLRPRDVCIFELVKRNQLQLKVSIFRQSGLAQE